MRIVVAPDSFKGSLSAMEVAEAMKKGILAIDKDSDVQLIPMADGGEGTLDCMMRSREIQKVPITCKGPLGDPIHTYYGILDEHTAIIESALIAGLMLVPKTKQDIDHLTTYGIGEVILDAMNKGCTSFIIGIGGSATNDGGFGMLQALGMKAYDQHQLPVGIFGQDLLRVDDICVHQLDSRLNHVTFKIACDVDNPLCGEAGASAIYGPQKGATPNKVENYDKALSRYSELMEAAIGQSVRHEQGAGAAGGLGFAFLALGAEIVSGSMLMAEITQLEAEIKQADLIVTGEGRSDNQTLFGKVPGYIATLANQYHTPVILLSGSIASQTDLLTEKFAGCFSIINEPLTVEECMENAEQLIMDRMKQLMRLVVQVSLVWH